MCNFGEEEAERSEKGVEFVSCLEGTWHWGFELLVKDRNETFVVVARQRRGGLLR